jgi:RNA polymerase-binding transcription factor DksA
VTDVSHVPDDQPPPVDTAGDTADTLDAVDLDAIEHDLTAVEVALNRLADGTYWTDEVTAQPIPDDVLVHNPLARRA